MAESSIVSPFCVEVDQPRNCDVLLQSIPNARLRSAISASKPTIVNNQDKDNTPVIPKDQARHLGSLPPIPGMRLHVTPGKLSYLIEDPLYEDEALCKRIVRALEADDRPSPPLGGVPPQEGTLDQDRMKCLCREVIWLLEAGDVRMVKGIAPVLEDVEELPGEFLLNPGSQVPNGQPRYEKDLEEYKMNLQRVGG